MHAGTRVRRRDLGRPDVVERRGLRVTALTLTVVEAAALRGGGSAIMDSALQQQIPLSELWRSHLRHKGRYGAPAARRLLQAADDGARSQAERLLAQLLRSASLTGWRTNYKVGRYRVDFAFPKHRVAIEVDGWAFHSDRADFQHDRERQNEIMLMRWQVLRFTWLDLTAYPERVLARSELPFGVIRCAERVRSRRNHSVRAERSRARSSSVTPAAARKPFTEP